MRGSSRSCQPVLLAWLCLAAPAAAQSELEKALDQRLTDIAAMIEDYPRVAGLTSEERRKLVEFTAGNLLFVLGHDEIVQEFAQLYRSYRKITVAAMADDEALQIAANFHSAAE